MDTEIADFFFFFFRHSMNHARCVICTLSVSSIRVTHNDSAMTARGDGRLFSHLLLFLLSFSLSLSQTPSALYSLYIPYFHCVSGETGREIETEIMVPLSLCLASRSRSQCNRNFADDRRVTDEDRSTPISSDLRRNLFSRVRITYIPSRQIGYDSRAHMYE